MASGTTEETLDACCLTEYRPLPGIPNGKILKIGEINCYHIAGKDQASKGKAIVMLTDIFGLTKNPRITADELSEKSGFDVFVPDMFNGDAVASSFLKDFPETPGEKTSIGTKLYLGSKFVGLGPWLFRHRQAVTLPILQNFLKTLRTEHAITRIQAVGYCFGGYYVLLLGSNQWHLVDAVVGCHVSMTSKGQFEQIQVPVALVCAEEDNQFSEAARQQAEQILSRKSEVPSKILLTEGTVHGFASRPNTDNPMAMKGYKQANDLIVQWAKTYL